MNKIEQKFYDAWVEENENPDNDISMTYDLVPQFVIGIYKVDFICSESGYNFAIEIDGHEFHKTKEQREIDYKRERYLMRHRFMVIRFTGTEVYLSPHECAAEAQKMIDDYILREVLTSLTTCEGYHAIELEREEVKKSAEQDAIHRTSNKQKD